MSGGSYDYMYQRVEEMAARMRDVSHCYPIPAPVRRAFRAHLCLVAAACRAIEWNDSGDGAEDEEELIQKCLAPGVVLNQAISDAKDALDALSSEIARAEEVVT